MERLKSLNRYQKSVLLLSAVMVLVFTVLYPRSIARVGYEYKNALLLPSQEKDGTVYSGSIQGTQASFTVSPDKTVTFQYGETAYGPYTAKEDPTAIPEGNELGGHMTGVELRRGEAVIFRGGVLDAGGYRLLYNENGESENFTIFAVTSYGIVMDENGQVIDPMEPSIATILDLMATPELTHKGDWLPWFLGVFLCAVTAISILFADELFRLDLVFRVRDPEQAEPSDFQIAGRYISWTILPLAALLIFILGLQ